MPIFDNEEDEITFFELNRERAVAIALPAIIENHLTAILKVATRPDARIWNELFNPNGPLGNFGTKIRLTYMLGLIESTRLKDLTIISKIRNEFAHKISIKRFDQHPISAWIKDMHVYTALVAVRDGQSPPDDRSAHLARWISNDELQSSLSAFRSCVRVLIHDLNEIEKSISEPKHAQPS